MIGNSDLRQWLYHSAEAGPYRAALRAESYDLEDLEQLTDDELDEVLLSLEIPLGPF